MQTDPAILAPVAGELVQVWDVPTRIFHWSTVALVFASWLSADRGLMTVHLWSGLSLLALLLFRVGWGLIGSSTSRFGDFLSPPRRVLAYLGNQARGGQMLHAGHNPAGGLMVLVMLVVLVAQIPIGLFANDGLKFSGPLAHLVTHDDFDRPTRIHSIVFNFILALVWLNLVAVGYYYLVRGDNLIGPMLSGKKNRARVPAGVTIMLAHPALALVLLLASAAVVAWILF